ncbi:MAG: DUF4139 domain-containing protein [Gammaproteobacteria bacterium]|nr:DUF4139 domain-containing protein [Gammaproteobacteria bacterium]
MKPLIRLVLSAIALLGMSHAMSAETQPDAKPELRSTLQDQQAVAVTIYNQQLALIKDVRRITLHRGLNRLAFRDVSAQIKPETALLRSISDPVAIQLLEQNFDFDLLSPRKLLQKFVGKRVRVIKTHPTSGVESEQEALVLSANEGVVLRIGERIETGVPGRVVYDQVPDNLRDRPTLTIILNSDTDQPQRVELSYLTAGLGWKADYVAELSSGDDRLDLNGWVTLTNQSGTSYRQARLQLVAGDVHRVQDRRPAVPMRARTLMGKAAREDAMSQEDLFEYHLYTLERLTDIADNQTKQVALLSAAGIPVSKEYLLKGGDYYYRRSLGDLGKKIKVAVFIEFKNEVSANLGMPLPKGIVRVYKRDSKDNAQFVGEDRVDHTPRNEKVRLKLGDAFDITAEKRQTDFRKIAVVGRYDHASESSYRIMLKNAKPEPVTVTVQEPVPGDWKITKQSHAHEKQAAGTAVWKIQVPAQGKATLTYTVQLRY